VRVSVALSQPPTPEGGAPGKCAIGLLRGLVSNGVAVQAVAAQRSFADAPASLLGVPPDLPVVVVGAEETLGRTAVRLSKVRRPRGELGRGTFEQAFCGESEGADVLHLEETETGWSGRSMPVPRVLHVHYLTALDRRGVRPGRDALHAAELVYAEILLARSHRWLVASSPVVASTLRRISPRSRTEVVPLSLDPAYYEPAPLDGPPVVGVIGTASWQPTARAMRRLVHQLWPRIHREVPEAVLRIAGRGSERFTDFRGVAGVEVVGEVASAAAFLRDLSVLAYPLVRGSGMKVKVLEALATGLPVVTTPSGAEGIGPTDGVVVTEKDDEIVEAVRDVLADPAARRQRGAASRNTFLHQFSPHVAMAPLPEIYRLAAARG